MVGSFFSILSPVLVIFDKSLSYKSKVISHCGSVKIIHVPLGHLNVFSKKGPFRWIAHVVMVATWICLLRFMNHSYVPSDTLS